MKSIRRPIWLVILVILGSIASPRATLAQTSRTVYVDDSGTPVASRSGACGSPNYALLQQAVDDLSATRVIVCKGTYVEQVAVARSLTIEGRSGAVLQSPLVPSVGGAIVAFVGVQQSRLRGLTIRHDSASGDTSVAGVIVRDGAQVTIAHNRFRNMYGGILVSNARADISDNSIEWVHSEAINVSGSNTFAMIDGNTFRGRGVEGGLIGIDIREGGHGDVEDNTIVGNGQDGGIGIVVDLTDQVSIRDNTVTRSGRGIVLGDETGDVEVRSNVIRNNSSDGIFLTDAGFNTIVENEVSYNGGSGIWVETAIDDPNAFQNVIATNRIHDNLGDGIHIGAGVSGATVKENKVANSGGLDIVDLNGMPLINTYADNSCATSAPAGLCDQ